MEPTFRNETNQRYTRQLFFEQWRDLPQEFRLIDPPYTLGMNVEGKINFRKVYVELGDPTGYQLAIRYLEDYSHWNLLMKSVWFREAKEIWDAELDAKLSSEGLAAIRLFADGVEGVNPAVQLSAAKYLSDKAYRKTTAAAPRGRPSKAEVAANAAQATSDATDIASDLARISKLKSVS